MTEETIAAPDAAATEQTSKPKRKRKPEPVYVTRHNGQNRAARRQFAQLTARRARYEARWKTAQGDA